MEPQPDLRKLQRKAFNYMDQDGLTEIMLGLMMIALGFVFQSTTMSIILALLCLPSIKLLEKVRERFTYPRTGYAKLPAEYYIPSRWTMLIYSLCLTSVYILLIYFTGGWDTSYPSVRWTPLLIGGSAVGAGLVVNRSARVPKLYFYAAAGIALGVYLSVLSIVKTPDNILHGGAIWALWYGVFMLIAGAIVLIRFIFKYKPQPGDESNGQ